MIVWPTNPDVQSLLGRWLKQLLDCCKASAIIAVDGGRVETTANGTKLFLAPGGAASVGGWHWHDIANREYDPSIDYSQNEVVVLSADNEAVTTGYPKSPAQLANDQANAVANGDPDPNPNNFATPGRWVYVGTSPSRTADPTGDTTQDIIQLPQWPLPDDTDIDSVTSQPFTPVCWELISLGPMEYIDCVEGVEKPLHVNAAEKIDHDEEP